MRLLPLSLLLAISLAACGGSDVSGALGLPLPEIGPIVVNVPDSFTVVPMGLVPDGSRTHRWLCSVGQANLTIGGMSAGEVHLEIWDGAGTPVHDNTYGSGIMGAIVAVTRPGAAGLWTLRFTYDDVLGMGTTEISADTNDDLDAIVIAGSYNFDTTFLYDVGWPAGSASANLVSAISLGTGRVRLWDGAGALVLDKTNHAIFVGVSAGDSLPGAAGIWHIQLDLDAVATAGAITITHP